MTSVTIPEPRGEGFRFLGYRPGKARLEWICEHLGREAFVQELEHALDRIPQDLAGPWKSLFTEKQALAREIRVHVYTLLAERISPNRFRELIEDHHEFEKDTFLTLLDSHVRLFFLLIPQVADTVARYEALCRAFDQADQALARHLTDGAETDNAARVIVNQTIRRLMP